MFNRQKYKKQARLQLKGRRTLTVLITLITFLITSLISSEFTSNLKNNSTGFSADNSIAESSRSTLSAKNYSWNYEYNFGDFYTINTSSPQDFILSLISISIIGILVLAQNRVYNEYFRVVEKVTFNFYLSSFSYWLKGALSMLWCALWVTLWSFLFIIPGIVKLYSYRQMFYVLAENPKIGVLKAMNISKTITKGFKGDLFVMDLSFFGWFLLSAFTGGILLLWVIPYYNMTCVNAYKDIKIHALKTGIIELEDFN